MILWCPVCATEVLDRELTHVRRIWIDAQWRAYRKHRRCGTAIGLPLHSRITAWATRLENQRHSLMARGVLGRGHRKKIQQ